MYDLLTRKPAHAEDSNSSKNFVAELLDGATVHMSVLETKLRGHHTELARLKTAWSAPGSAIEESLLCPITCELIHDPVVATDGSTYEHAAIGVWFETGKVVPPMTNVRLASLMPTRSSLVRSLISKILEECRRGLNQLPVHRAAPW